MAVTTPRKRSSRIRHVPKLFDSSCCLSRGVTGDVTAIDVTRVDAGSTLRKRSSRIHRAPKLFDPSFSPSKASMAVTGGPSMPRNIKQPVPSKKQQPITKYCRPGSWVQLRKIDEKSTKCLSFPQLIAPHLHKKQFKWNFAHLKDHGLVDHSGSSSTINLQFLRHLWSFQSKLKRQEDAYLNGTSKGLNASQMALENQRARHSKVGA